MAMTKPLSMRLYNLLRSEFEHSSQNLKRFANKRNYLKNHNRIIKAGGELYIGFIDDIGLLNGAKLVRVACGQFDKYAYTGIKHAEDVTEWFMSEYQNKGMCAYTDMRHVWNIKDGHVGTTRFCIHCGHKETKRSEMVEKTWWE